MVQLGKYNKLRVVKEVHFGVYLDGGEEYGEILMPLKYVPEGCQPEDWVDVFVYLDSEDRPVATTEEPYATVGEFALLEVVSVSNIGAFMDWGLLKDLLVPFREQKQKMEEGKSYIVYIYFDHESKRIVGSAKLDKFLDNLPIDYTVGQEVNLLICNPTDIGYNAIINNSHWGIIYKNEVFQNIKRGQQVKGFIKKIREDEKIDLSLQPIGYQKVDSVSEKIINKLKINKGFMAVNDKTEPDVIYQLFGISKKTFKQAIGGLYKSKVISINEDGISLIN